MKILILAIIITANFARNAYCGIDITIDLEKDNSGEVLSALTLPGADVTGPIKVLFRGIIEGIPPNLEQPGFVANADGTLVGVNVRRATKNSTPILIARTRGQSFMVVENFNELLRSHVSKELLNTGNLFFRSIEGNICRMGSLIETADGTMSTSEFSVTIQAQPSIKIVNSSE